MSPQTRWWLTLIAWTIVRWLLPMVPIPPALFAVAAGVAIGIGTAWLLWLTSEGARLWHPRTAAGMGIGALALWWALAQGLTALKPGLMSGLLAAVRDGCLLVAALGFGAAGAAFIRHANLLPPIAVVVTVMDIWTVLLGGFVHKVQQKAPKVVEAASVALPVPTASKAVSITLPLVGVGDWFFAAFFFALLWRFGLKVRATYWLATVLMAAVLTGLALGLAWLPLALPGLPFLALAVLIPHWRSFHYTPQEKRALAVGGLFLAGLLVLFSLIARQM